MLSSELAVMAVAKKATKMRATLTDDKPTLSSRKLYFIDIKIIKAA